MKMKIEVQGCPFEDRSTLQAFSQAQDSYHALCEVRRLIRERIKRGDPSDEEEKFLQTLLDECRIVYEE